ncbi:MAG: transposase [Thermotogae bacterium]|nr:transposase [Thermotogota bacterium]
MLFTGEEISPQTVSKIAKELDEKVEEFLNKPVEKEIPYFHVALEKDKNDEHIGEGEQRTEKTQQSSRSISK